MAKDDHPDLLTFADSVLLKKESTFRELSRTEGPFKRFFCSSVDEVTRTFCTDSRIFGQPPKFEPKTRPRPVVVVKPVERKAPVEDDCANHWTQIAQSERFRDFSISDTWESLPRTECSTETDTRGELALSDIGESDTVHLLWSIAVDKLCLLSNVEKPSLEIVPEATFLTDLTSLMLGLESSTFYFDAAIKSFGLRRNFVVENISFETLQSFVERFIQMGNESRRLEGICNSEASKNRGQTYLGLISGLRSFLRLYRTTIVQVSQNRKLLELNFVTLNFRRQLNFVANIFNRNLPDGIPLLVHLCEQSLPVNTADLHHLSVFLFRSAAHPFFRFSRFPPKKLYNISHSISLSGVFYHEVMQRFFRRWAFRGKMDETSLEFGLSISVPDMNERNRRFWTNAFRVNGSTEGFGFLQQFLPLIVTCGKTINFLKLTDSTSAVVTFAPKLLNDEIQLIMTPDQEEEVKSKYSKLYSDFKQLCFEQNVKKSETSDGVDQKCSTVEQKSGSPTVEDKVENKYPSNFDLFETDVSDILTKVRKESSSNVSRRPCFTPLVALMEKSVLLPLKYQLSIMNEKGVVFLLRDSNLLGHLRAIRRYLFFGDAEFSHSLCSSLFWEMALHPEAKCGPGQLSSIVESAIGSSPFASKDPLAKNVSFYVDDNFGRNIRESVLTLSYKTDWPVNIILTEECMASYRQVFTFLIQIARCTWGLGQVFMKLKNNRDPDVQKLHLVRHQMSHFILLLDSYVKSIIIEQSWIVLNEDFDLKTKSIDGVYEAHNNYIKRILFRCFLNKKAEPVRKLFTQILNNVATFSEIIIRDDWSNELCRSKIESLFANFKKEEKFLSGVLWKLTNRGYQQHLQEFLLQLDAKHTENTI